MLSPAGLRAVVSVAVAVVAVAVPVVPVAVPAAAVSLLVQGCCAPHHAAVMALLGLCSMKLSCAASAEPAR